MKKKIIIIMIGIAVFAGIILKVLGIYRVKELILQSPIPDLYIKYIRREKVFDPDHVITSLDNGMPIIVNKHDRCVCWFIRLLGHWDSNETRVLEHIIKKGFKIIEVGANFGVYTLKMAQLVGEKGKIYAFEANPTVSKYLSQSIKINNLNSIVTLFEKAAGDIPGQSFLNFGLQNIGGGHLVETASPFSVKTEIVRLDDVVKEEHIDVLKIDAEGFELKILKGAKSIIDKNIDHIIIIMEFIPTHLENQKSDPKEIVNLLKSYGFNLWKVGKKSLGEQALVPITYDDLFNLTAADILASRKSFL